ncbi:MAG: hypothetical protein JXR52_06480 [Bacteroidales bacterium]|nr:hypothetical protein [Bacteroidales bacterium]MBN2698455.1 hypothetical protein [Bacteroidales bacterium]
MKRYIAFIISLFGLILTLHAQKSKILSVYQYIETDMFEDAKRAVEEAIRHEKTAEWPKTWFAKGFLCQVAYEEGVKENDNKKKELYPDQLYLAYESYEKALALDTRDRLKDQIARQYVLLSNDFQKIGKDHYQRNKFREASKAFEHALAVAGSPVLASEVDTSLIYNAAIAAFKSHQWDRAIAHLDELNQSGYSINTVLLLFRAQLEKGDTISAENVLRDGIERYNGNDSIILQLATLLFEVNDHEGALSVLDEASVNDSSNYIFPYTKGLIYQKLELYEEAIEAYKLASFLAPEETGIYTSIGTCYYNIGVEIEEHARTITDRYTYRVEKAKSKTAFEKSLNWMEKAYALDQSDQEIIIKLYRLYQILQKTDKINSLKDLVPSRD